MQPTQQTVQPVPFFYGALEVGTTVQDLSDGYDYVVTGLWWVGGTLGTSSQLIVEDENGVILLSCSSEPSGPGALEPFVFQGELPIGPRASLTFDVGGAPGSLLLAGYALTPPSALHI